MYLKPSRTFTIKLFSQKSSIKDVQLVLNTPLDSVTPTKQMFISIAFVSLKQHLCRSLVFDKVPELVLQRREETMARAFHYEFCKAAF